MMFSLVLMIGSSITLAAEQVPDCGISSLLIYPGQDGINADRAANGVYLSPFPMPAYIYNESGSMLHVSVYQNTRTCLSVSGEPDCANDFRVQPNAFDVSGPPIERGTILYRDTTDESELSTLADYLCPGFIARQAVIITYYCLGEIQSVNISETVQVIITTGEDADGVNRTIVLTTLEEVWQQSTMYAEIGRTGFFYYYTISENQTKSFDITYLTGWASSPQVVPEIPATCPPPPVTCEVTLGGHLTKFDGGEENLTNGKLTLAEWNPGKIDCKFKLVANINGNNKVKWVRFAVGPHKNEMKYFRLVDFNKSPGNVEQRGWKCKAGCKGVISSFDHDLANDDGTVYATVREINPGDTYVIDTQLCSGASDPDYKMTFHFSAGTNQIRASLELSHQFYVDNQNQLTGYCLQ